MRSSYSGGNTEQVDDEYGFINKAVCSKCLKWDKVKLALRQTEADGDSSILSTLNYSGNIVMAIVKTNWYSETVRVGISAPNLYPLGCIGARAKIRKSGVVRDYLRHTAISTLQR